MSTIHDKNLFYFFSSSGQHRTTYLCKCSWIFPSPSTTSFLVHLHRPRLHLCIILVLYLLLSSTYVQLAVYIIIIINALWGELRFLAWQQSPSIPQNTQQPAFHIEMSLPFGCLANPTRNKPFLGSMDLPRVRCNVVVASFFRNDAHSTPSTRRSRCKETAVQFPLYFSLFKKS